MDVEDPQGDAASELATARSLHEWARKLPQPAWDKELPAAKKRLEQADGEDKKRKPPAERLQSALSRVDHRQRQAQAAKDALREAQQAIGVLEAECLHQDALLRSRGAAGGAEPPPCLGPYGQGGGSKLLPGPGSGPRVQQQQRNYPSTSGFFSIDCTAPSRRAPRARTSSRSWRLAGSLSIPATQEPIQELQAAGRPRGASCRKRRGPRKCSNRPGSNRRGPMRVLGGRPRGLEREAPVRREPRWTNPPT